MSNSTLVMRGNNTNKPLTLGELVTKLWPGEAIIAEFPNGKCRCLNMYSRLDKIDASLRIVKPCKYDWAYGTYYVEIVKYQPGLCVCDEFRGSIEVSKDEKITIKPENSHYGIDPIGSLCESDARVIKELTEWSRMERSKIMYREQRIKKIIYSGPATIIFWSDGTKTVVKAKDEVDNEKGILYAALKKFASKKEYNDILRAIDKADETCKKEEVLDEMERKLTM